MKKHGTLTLFPGRRIPLLALAATLLAFSTCSIPLFHDHSRRFVFSKQHPEWGLKQLYLSREGSPEEILLTKDPNIECSGAVWSPDGSRIAYTEYDPNTSYSEVYVINGDSSGRTHISRNPGFLDNSPSWSPDGSQITWLGFDGATMRLLVANADGSDIQDLIPDLNAEGPASPSWSPDSRMIVLSADIPAIPPDPAAIYEIVVVDVHNKSYRRLTKNTVIDDSPAWSPDGRKIVYLRDFGLFEQVVTCNPDGIGEIVHTNSSAFKENPCWSPDGRIILFHSQLDHPSYFTLRTIGRDSIDEGREVCSKYLSGSTMPISISPDGLTILCSAYSNLDPTYRIISVRTDGSGYDEFITSSLSLDNPAWSPR